MSLKLTVSLLIGIAFYLAIIVVLIKKEQLNLKYTLLWLFSGVVMILLACIPQIAVGLSKLLGIETPANTIFIIEALFALLIILSLTSIASTQMLRIRRLTQTQAILEKRVQDLEKKVDELTGKKE